MSLRDALAQKRRRETFYDVVVGDPTEPEERHEAARRELRRVQVTHGSESPQAEAAKAAVEQARADLRDCTYRLTFRNLPSHEFEALVGEHKPTKAQQDAGDQWNADTFRPALIAACAVDSDMTAAEWADELNSERWNRADRDALFMAALAANVVPRSVTVPKD